MNPLISRAKAIELARSANFQGCTLAEAEEIVRLTGSKKAEAHRLEMIRKLGPIVKDARGNLIRR